MSPTPQHRKPVPRRLDAYIRVSSTRGREGSEKFTSPTDQERAIRKWGELYGHEITTDGPDGDGAWHELDESGGSMDRPYLNEVLARVDAGESDGLVVYRLDRFGRTLIGALTIIERLHAEGKVFASVMDNFDITTENGRLVLRIMLSLGQYERERIQSTWRTAKNNAVERGWHLSAKRPFGYQREELFNTKGEPYLGGLVVDPIEGPIVTKLFERRAAGDTWSELAKWLRSTGVLTSRGGTTWGTRTLSSIIANRVYLGVAGGGAAGFTKADAHPALTDPATWHAAGQRTGRAPKRPAGGTNHPAVGVGVVRCAGCRYVANVAIDPNAKRAGRANDRLDFNYICYRKDTSADCDHRLVAPACRGNGGATVDDVIAERVLARYVARIGFQALDTETDDLEALEADWLQASGRAEECALDFALEQEIGTPAWRKRSAALRQIADEKFQALTQAKQRAASDLVPGRSARELIDDWQNNRLSVDEKRTLVRNMTQAIFVRPAATRWNGTRGGAEYLEELRGRVHIVWADEAIVDVPRQGNRQWTPKPFDFPS